MPDIEFKAVANTEVAVAQLKDWWGEAQDFIGEAIEEELNEVLEDIKANYVPIDTGDLRDTGRVIPVEIDGQGNLKSGIEFGGDDVLYARIQHENLTYYHPHGQAKYIEVPLRLWVESQK